jgi:DNA gyrase subunit A
VVSIRSVTPGDELMLITRKGVVNRQRADDIRVIGRATQGVRLVALDESDEIVDVARVIADEEEGAVDGDLVEVEEELGVGADEIVDD